MPKNKFDFDFDTDFSFDIDQTGVHPELILYTIPAVKEPVGFAKVRFAVVPLPLVVPINADGLIAVQENALDGNGGVLISENDQVDEELLSWIAGAK